MLELYRWKKSGPCEPISSLPRCVLNAGIDFVTIGRAAILHHDFPRQVLADPGFEPIATSVSWAHLAAEGLSPVFI